MAQHEIMPAIGDEHEKIRVMWICIYAAGEKCINPVVGGCLPRRAAFLRSPLLKKDHMLTHALMNVFFAAVPHVCLLLGMIYRSLRPAR